MLNLFLDTTNGISVGLLDDNFQWLHYNFVESNKSSSIVHKLIKDALDSIGKEQSDIKKSIQVSGPGSYTGMRVSDGISQILDWQGIETYGLYHFQVPRILGYVSGAWLAKAFKGEIFVYEWGDEKFEQYMIKESELSEFLSKLYTKKKKIFSSLNFNLIPQEAALIETKALIKASPQEVFHHVISKKMKEPLYYFRALEDEFSKAKK